MSEAYRLSAPDTPIPLSCAFPFTRESGHVIAIVGAGGKTTIMYNLARLMAASGLRVCVTTTTHIVEPPDYDALRRLDSRWEHGDYAVLGRRTGDGKLAALSDMDHAALCSICDCVLAEADGSKRLPAKAPAAHEPRIPANADIVIAVQGFSAVGGTVSGSCHRPDIAADILGVGTEHILTARDLAVLLTSERGGRKNVGSRKFFAVLNQCDSDTSRHAASGDLKDFASAKADGILLLHFEETERNRQ